MRLLLLALLAATTVSACTAEDGTLPATIPEKDAIEVFTGYRGGDAASFRAVLDQFEELTGFEVRHVGSAALAHRIQERVDESDPPDVALLPQPGLIRELATAGDIQAMSELDPALAEAVESNFDGVTRGVSIDDEIYALPFRVNVSSLIWYRPDVFDEWGYEVPESIADLRSLLDQITADGFVPWCIGISDFDATGWVGTDWIEDLLLREQSLEFYDLWAAGDVAFDTAPVRRAFTSWHEIALAPGRHFGTTRTILNTPWANAADPMLEDDPGCLLHRQSGEWVYSLPDDVVLGDGIDVFAVPPETVDQLDPILLNGEFATAFTDRPGVAELMSFLLDPQSGAIWAGRGGYVSPHPEFDHDDYASEFDRRLAGLIAAADVLRFDGSDTMPPAVGTGSFWEGVVEYVATRDLDITVAIIDYGFTPADDQVQPSS